MKKLVIFLFLTLIAFTPHTQQAQVNSVIRTHDNTSSCAHVWGPHYIYFQRGKQWYVISATKCQKCGVMGYYCGTPWPVKGPVR